MNKTKWILLIVALGLIFGNFDTFKEDAGSFVPFAVADGFQLTPAAKYIVVTSQEVPAQTQPNIYPILGLALLAVIIFSKD